MSHYSPAAKATSRKRYRQGAIRFAPRTSVGSALEEASLPPSADASGNNEDDRWAQVRRHTRYLSEWEDDVIVVDVTHLKAKTKRLQYIPLDATLLACTGGKSMYTKNMPLTHFRGFTDAVKIVVNAVVERNSNGNVWGSLTRTLRTMERIFIWLIRQGIYELADVKQALLDELLRSLSHGSWRRTLRYHRSLYELLLLAQTEPMLVQEIVGSGSKAYRHTPNVRIDRLEQIIGLPLKGDQIPLWFRTRIAKLSGDNRRPTQQVEPQFADAKYEVYATVQVINLLSLHPEGFDSIPFLPYPDTSTVVGEFDEDSGGRTVNLDLPTCMKLTNDALIWLYDRGPLVVDLLKEARCSLLEKTGTEKWVLKATRARVRKAYLDVKDSLALPYPDITLDGDVASLKGIVNTLQSAMVWLIGFNHGRRPNEVVGRNVPYGLYFGALRSAGEGYNEWTVEFYVEKSIQDYVEFAANELVADAIALLDDIYCEYCPLDENIKGITLERAAGRDMKLFSSRPSTLAGYQNPPNHLILRVHIREFFRLAGVSPDLFSKSQLPLRRIFILIYLNRYDCVEYPAISRHLGHSSVRSIIPYSTDPANREAGKRIENTLNHHRTETARVIKVLKEGESEYLRKCVRELFEERPASGFFPLLVIKLAKRLSEQVEFLNSSFDEKIEKVSTTLEKRGYLPRVLQHGACMGHTARHTIKLANCCSEHTLHRELASPAMCQHCVHHFSNDGYLHQLEEDIEQARADSEDFRLPPKVRVAKAQHAARLEALVEAERATSAQIRERVRALLDAWERVILKASL